MICDYPIRIEYGTNRNYIVTTIYEQTNPDGFFFFLFCSSSADKRYNLLLLFGIIDIDLLFDLFFPFLYCPLARLLHHLEKKYNMILWKLL